MAAGEINNYANDLRSLLAGVGAALPQLNALTAAAATLAALAGSAPEH